jgi:hypothetical protein
MFKKVFYVILTIIIILAIGLTIYFLIVSHLESTAQQPAEVVEPDRVVYKDPDYGFIFTLPDSWRDYTVVADEWQGYANIDPQGDVVIARGPLVLLRHPLWTADSPRQDIPVMVFTIQQWIELRDEKFHIGAAPMGPSELGRNTTYVFALPARYNYAFLTGYEEVDQIIQGKSFRAY